MKRLTVFAAALALASYAQAGALDQFKAFATGTKSARGQFEQRIIKAAEGAGKPGKPASGTFVFSRPGKFIWTYQQPYQQVLQADGEKLYIYDKDLNQVTVRKLGDALGQSPAAILFGSNELEKNFTLKEAGTRDGLEWLSATPKARDSQFQAIAIGMKNGLPERMELQDGFGQVSLLTFGRFEKNPALGADQFKFDAPKGADVFNQ